MDAKFDIPVNVSGVVQKCCLFCVLSGCRNVGVLVLIGFSKPSSDRNCSCTSKCRLSEKTVNGDREE